MRFSLWAAAFIAVFSSIFLGLSGANQDLWYWDLLAGALPGALVASVLLLWFLPLLYFVLGFLCGFVVVAQLVGGFLPLMWLPSYFVLMLWSLSLLAGGVYGLLSLYLSAQQSMHQKYVVILNTSVLGGFLFVVGMDFFSQDRYAAVIAEMFKANVVLIDPWLVSLSFTMVWLMIAVFGFGLQRMVISSRTFHYRPRALKTEDSPPTEL
jgi:hypothetical protein